ncbi:MAG: DUF6103 family protein [Ruminococcus flavefaciens]|nr:DUF6103 family protein [Ruminococcus flavefaciens]
MKKTVILSVAEEKVSAVEMYLGQKNTTLSEEVDRFVEQLYSRNVPQNVRDFIDMMSEKKQTKNVRKSEAKSVSEQ